VIVLAVALHCVSVRVKDSTGLLEDALVDQRGVVAFVLHACVSDDPGIVGAEHRCEL
jgi:hypothetical protein